MNVYSKAANGKPEESSSVGMKGLHPVKLTSRSNVSSVNWIVAKGKWLIKLDELNRRRPKVVCPNPFPVWAAPNILDFGTFPFPNPFPFPFVILRNINGNEYALVGTNEGFSVVDVTIPEQPTELFFIETLWPDITKKEIKNIFEKYKSIERKYGL